jgi:hypothetical protein
MKNLDGSLQTITIVTVLGGVIQDVSAFARDLEGDKEAFKHFATQCPNCSEALIADSYRYGRYENDDYEVIIYLT